MKKFFNKLEAKADALSQEFLGQASPSKTPVHQNQPSTIQPPTSDDIFRYRYHHGANLGSIFVLEKWLSGSMFPESAKGESELDAVKASVNEKGIDETRCIWENHWRSAVSQQDWDWFRNAAKGTSIRLPVGWWMMGGSEQASRLKGTEWAGLEGVYCNAWTIVREFVATAHNYGVGVLLDLHGLPGGANAEDHSGTSSHKASLWGNKKNLTLAKQSLHFMATEIHAGMHGVEGLQIVNESVHNAQGMYDFYSEVIEIIGRVDESIPIIISDAWDLPTAISWTQSRHPYNCIRNPIIIDTHRYYTFSDKDRASSPQQIISTIPNELHEVNPGTLCDKGEVQIIVGEWSNVLDGQTWSRASPQEKDPLVHQFGLSQSSRWLQKSSGSYFWTFKMDWMDGGEWGFVEQTKKSNILIPPFLTIPFSDIHALVSKAQAERQGACGQARGDHENYWNGTSPGEAFEHHLFGEGWEVGFEDAMAFFGARCQGRIPGGTGCGGDRIGGVEGWVKKRVLESGQRGKYAWEWEQGFRNGVGCFERAVGIL
ncbi:hypothetical protein HYFRA_00006777 [Hymenoscyphus fraxineus]|uniref:Glycoside hydrolase family 5 domain-containing protein n=1 Tax=Hymenoscyphus fraxineus TaxID=746836 RepID=A0A9N9PNS1_9HELO|nr:hypothetical protein HYFRA_00006777 [Hymenoscyphus fraxineus]